MKVRLLNLFAFLSFLAFPLLGRVPIALAEGQEDWVIVAEIPTVTYAWGVELNNDGSLVYVTGRAGDVVAYDSTTFEVVGSTHLPVGGGDSLGISVLTPDQKYFITGDEHGSLYFLDAEEDPVTLPLALELWYGYQKGPNARIAVTSDSQQAITESDEYAGQRSNSRVRFYDLSGAVPVENGTLSLAADTKIIAITPDDTMIYTPIGSRIGPAQQVYVIDIASQQHIATIDTGVLVYDVVMDEGRSLAYISSPWDTGPVVVNLDPYNPVVENWQLGPHRWLAYDPN